VTPRVAPAVVGVALALCLPLQAHQPASSGSRPPAAGPAFEVVSIRPNRSADDRPRLGVQPGGRYTWTNFTLKSLIGVSQQRYAFDSREIVGGPSWIDSDRFDIVAKAEDGAGLNDPAGFPGPLFAMIRAMLEERFELQTHNEIRERPVYALVYARADKRLGSGMKRVDGGCAAAMRELTAGPPRERRGPPPCSFGGEPGHVLGNGITPAMLSNLLAQNVGRQVVDRTGITDSFDVELEFVPDVAGFRGRGGAPGTDQPATPAGVSIFTAVQEQLGLKLEPTRAPVDVLVIDGAQRPTEN